PEAGEPEYAPVFHDYRVGLLGLGVEFPPLVERVRSNDAAALLERIPEGWFLRDSLRLRVDQAEADLDVLRPVGDQTPPQHVESAAATARIGAHDGDILSRRDVVARLEVEIVRDVVEAHQLGERRL